MDYLLDKLHHHIKDQLQDPEWIEQYGHCEIEGLQVGFGENWVKGTVLYQESLLENRGV